MAIIKAPETNDPDSPFQIDVPASVTPPSEPITGSGPKAPFQPPEGQLQEDSKANLPKPKIAQVPEPSGLPSQFVTSWNDRYGGNLNDAGKEQLAERKSAAIKEEMTEYAKARGVDVLGRELPASDPVEIEKYQKRVENIKNLWRDHALPAAASAGKDLSDMRYDFGRIILGGPLKAVEGVWGLADSMATWLNKNVADLRVDVGEWEKQPDGTMKWREGKGLGGVKEAPATSGKILPNIPAVTDDTVSVSGGIAQSIVQFITGFGAIGKAGIFANLAKPGSTMARAAITDFTTFDGQEGNLANLIQALGGKGQPIIDFLATDKDTPQMIGRIKNTLAGLVPDVALEGLVKGLRTMKAARRVKDMTGANTHQEAAERLLTTGHGGRGAPAEFGARVEDLLGGTSEQAIERVAVKLRPVHFEVPPQVAAKGLTEGAYTFPDVPPGKIRLYTAISPEDAAQQGAVHSYTASLDEARARAAAPDTRLAYADIDEAQWIAIRDEPEIRGRVATGPEAGAHGDALPKPLGERAMTADDFRPIPEVRETADIINWNRIDGDADLQRVMSRMAKSHADEIKGAQRGVRSNVETALSAEKQDAWQLLLDKRGKDAPAIYTAEETLALRNLWVSAGDKLVEVAEAAKVGGLEEQFAFRKMLELYNTLQQKVIGIRTEQARALQQWRMPAGSSADKLRQITMAIETHGGEGTTRALANGIADMARTGKLAKMEEFAHKAIRFKTARAVKELWMNSILSGPKTHMVNMMSNELITWNFMGERALAAQIAKVDPFDSGLNSVRAGEAAIMLQAKQAAMMDMFKLYNHQLQAIGGLRNWDDIVDPTIRVGRDKFEQVGRARAISSEGFAIDAKSPLGRGVEMVGAIVNVPGTMLGGADNFFKTINYRMELWSSAWRRAMQEVDRGVLQRIDMKKRVADLVSDPPDDLRISAEDIAAYNTFTNEPNAVAKSVMALRNNLDRWSTMNVGMPSGSFIFPFVNTPSNILAYSFDRTPFAAIGKSFRADVAAGGARRHLAMARVAMGSAIFATAYSLALNGHIMGSGPVGQSKWRERRHLNRAGQQKYSANFTTGYNKDGSPQKLAVAYNRMDPMGTIIGVAADLASFSVNSNDGRHDATIEEIVTTTSMLAANMILDKSYFTGASRLFGAFEEPRRGKHFYQNIVSGFVPRGLQEWGRIMEPQIKHTWDLASKLRNASPFHRQDLPPQLDFWGNPRTYKSGIQDIVGETAGTLYDSVSPIYMRTNKRVSAIDREFFRLGYFPVHGDGSPNMMKFGRVPVNLRNLPEVKNTWTIYTAKTSARKLLNMVADDAGSTHDAGYLVRRGGKARIKKLKTFGNRNLKEALTDLIAGKLKGSGRYKWSERYHSLPPDDNDGRTRIMQQIVSLYRHAAKVKTIRDHPELMDQYSRHPGRQGREVNF
jgi:hypothetical protein